MTLTMTGNEASIVRILHPGQPGEVMSDRSWVKKAVTLLNKLFMPYASNKGVNNKGIEQSTVA